MISRSVGKVGDKTLHVEAGGERSLDGFAAAHEMGNRVKSRLITTDDSNRLEMSGRGEESGGILEGDLGTFNDGETIYPGADERKGDAGALQFFRLTETAEDGLDQGGIIGGDMRSGHMNEEFHGQISGTR